MPWFDTFSVLAAVMAANIARAGDRPIARRCVAAFVIGWLIYISSWTKYAPYQLVYNWFDIIVQPEKFWAGADAIIGIYILTVAWSRYWGISLFLLFVSQELMHLAFAQKNIQYDAYLACLNMTFRLEVVCFLFAGGGRVRDMFDSYHARYGRRLAVRDSSASNAQKRQK